MKRDELVAAFRHAAILAPLTMGGNLPFRRLCVQQGADVTVSEMAFARKLVKGERKEHVLLRRHSDEKIFGVQLAALQAEEGAAAAKIVEDAGADFVDINCGCPIDEVTRRGLGAALLRRERTLARLIEAMTKAVGIPVTIKIRFGWNEAQMNVFEVAKIAEASGAAALTIHGRTRDQRYTKAADWDLIGKVKETVSIPVIGNGDILTPYEAKVRMERSGVSSIMIGRGALIKPWIFAELKSGEVFPMPPEERVAVFLKLAELQKEYFGSDEKGLSRCERFMAWHLDFFSRFRFYPEAVFGERSREHPLMQTRESSERPVDPMEAVLTSNDKGVHAAVARVIVRAAGVGEVLEGLRQVDLPVDASQTAVERELVTQG